MVGFSGTAFADSGQHINQWLNDITADNVPTRLEGDGYVIVVNQVLDKSEYKVGDTISVRPELINIGNKTVTIQHLTPLFQTLVKNQNGSIVWPSIGTAYTLRSDKIALEPHKPISDESNGILQHAHPIILRDAGKYAVISSAYFGIYDINDISPPMYTIKTEPLGITVLPDYSLDAYKLSPLKQFKSGIPIYEIQCKEGFAVAIKKSNGNPGCVKHETLEKLRERGWAESLGDIVFQRPSQSKLESDDTLSESNYVPHSPRCGSGVVPYIPDNWQTTGMHPSDETWEALGNYLMKQEFYKELQQRNIVFEPACFGVYTGMVEQSYPPRFSMCSVVTASNGTDIYLEGMVNEFDVIYFDIDNKIPYQCDDNHGGCLCGIENED